MKNRLWAVLACVCIIGLITACGGPATTAAPTAAPEEATAVPEAPEATAAPETGGGAEGVADVPRENTLILGWWAPEEFPEWEIWSPFAIGADYQRGLNITYEGMAYWNAFDNSTTMWQAESYEYNDDFTELTIHLRPEVMWSDGTPFTAADVVYTINHLRDIGSEVRHGNEVQRYTKEAVAVDDHTVLITMNQPSPRYFWLFFTWKWDSGAFPIMPKHIFEGQDWSTFTHLDIANGQPVTTGPLQLVYTSATQKIWDRRGDWWAVGAGLTDGLAMERVINVTTGGDPTVLTELMVTNQIDITHLGPDTARVAVEQNPKITTHSGRGAPYGYTDWWPQSLWLNYTVPPFDNPDVRWCISHLIDRQQLVDVAWEGNNFVNGVPWPPYAGLNAYTDSISDLLEQYPTTEYNPDKAAERCNAAGYTLDEATGLYTNDAGETIQVPLMSWLQWNATAQVLIEQLQRGGIDASYTTPPDAWDRYIGGDYVAFPAGHAGSLQEPFETMNLYKCPDESASYQIANYSKWCNPDFDVIVDQMALTDPADFDTMAALTHDAMELWLPALPDLPLINWMHNFGMNETYWTNWPTVDNTKDGEYVNEASQLLGFLLVMTHLEPAQ